MKLEPLQYRSESPVQGTSDRQQESRGFNPREEVNGWLIDIIPPRRARPT